MDFPARPLRRSEASAYLKEKHGIDHSPGYLAKLAVTGEGPLFSRAKRTPLYLPVHLDDYAAEITTPPSSSSERSPPRRYESSTRRQGQEANHD